VIWYRLSQNRLGLSLGVHPRRINEIVLQKRRVTADAIVPPRTARASAFRSCVRLPLVSPPSVPRPLGLAHHAHLADYDGADERTGQSIR
jgi:hypothetical protein